MYSLRDSDGIGPVHELARFGRPRAQLAILERRAEFDTDRFVGRYKNTPIDDLANFGCLEAQKAIMKLPKEELTRERRTGYNLVHALATRITNDDYLGLLGLPREILRTQTKNGENIPRIIYNQATAQMRGKLYEWNPSWNRI